MHLSDRKLEYLFPGDSELARQMRALDWSKSDLGSPEEWPDNLRVALGICLSSRFPLHVWWGPNLTLFYNDAYISFLGKTKHPAVLGRSGRDAWSEIWDTIGPMIERVFTAREASWSEDILMFFDRQLPKEEVYVTFSFSPIFGDAGHVDGMFGACTETTEKLVGNRRLETLRKLGVHAGESRTLEQACRTAASVFGDNPHDVPFAAIYVVDEGAGRAHRIASVGLENTDGGLPSSVSLGEDDSASPWRLAHALHTRSPVDIPDLAASGLRLSGGAWPESSPAARVIPIRAATHDAVAGLLVVGVSPRRPFDAAYRTFFDLVAGHVGTAISDARAYEEERRRAEALAELDRAGRANAPPSMGRSAFVEEALRWLPDEPRDRSWDAVGIPAATISDASAAAPPPRILPGARILLADDNADMRAYVRRLLDDRWTVEAVADGATALQRALAHPPDLVLADVMMPGLDGFGLLRELRADTRTASVPVIMLSARAGDEARVDGLTAGANDYLVKPFSARDLIARITVHLELGRTRRELEREREHARESADRKDEFLAMLAHELRNPLAPIRMALALIRNRLGASPVERQLDMIDRQATSLERIVNDLLEASRITRGKIELQKERLDLAAAVSRAVESTRSFIAQRRHEVSVELPTRPIFVHADPVRIDQVLMNLLVNAAKYTEPGGNIWIGVERADGNAEIRVRDTGIGIPQDMIHRIFDVFQQGRRDLARSQGGLGLGLSIVKKLVELHGGTVAATSAGPGKGSEFTVRLPMALEEAPSDDVSKPGEDLLGAHKAPRRRILVVDDNPDAAESLAEVLEDLGHEVRIAEDGPMAIKINGEWHPDVIFLDIGLPGMDGHEVAREIRRTCPDVPKLVALTGYGQESARRMSQEAGFARHLVKPPHLDTIVAVLDSFAATSTGSDH